MGTSVKKTIKQLDRLSANYGFSQEFGMILSSSDISTATKETLINSLNQANINNNTMNPIQFTPDNQMVIAPKNPMASSTSGNPMIQAKTFGKSTFMVNITVAKTGTGSGNTENPIWLFGANAFNNCSVPYSAVAVASPRQAVTTAFVNGKNVIVFTYTASVGNYSTYTISLGTTGEYPFILNSQVGKKGLFVSGVQMEISDTAYISQLTNEINTFYLNEYGKAVTNDLTTPTDLYQQLTNGIFLPHEFKISGDDGMQINVLEVNGFVVKLYFYANPLV